MPESQVGAIRALIEEGALSKATKLLLSRGLADTQDPSVEGKLLGLHPSDFPHLVAGADLPAQPPENFDFGLKKSHKNLTPQVLGGGGPVDPP